MPAVGQLRVPFFLKCGLNSVLNVNAPVGAFNQEKALVGAFSVIVKSDGSFAALAQIVAPSDSGIQAVGANLAAIPQNTICITVK